MTPIPEGELDIRSIRPNPWRILGLPLLVALALAGVAYGLPSHDAPQLLPHEAQAAACAGEWDLPPGHPPIDGLHGAAPLRLPPGHPPVDGRAGVGRAAPPQAPIFEEPKVLDI
jgi:hypothetical protein